MANAGMKPVAGLLLVLNFCMYVIVAAVGGWAINHATTTASSSVIITLYICPVHV
jgi:hypothetical protein